MKLEEVKNRLNEHREHYRVLPANAREALNSLMYDLAKATAFVTPKPEPVKVKETPSVVGKRTQPTKKVSKRPRR